MNWGMKKITTVAAAIAVFSGVGVVGVHAAVKNNNMIRWVDKAPLSTMDPSKVSAAQDFNGLTATGDGLTRQDKDGEPALALAESYKTSEKGTVYTFKLRPDLKWSNGDDLTAHDFVYGWRRTNDPKTASEYAYLYAGVKNAEAIQSGEEKDLTKLGIEALDDRTLKVTLDQPMPALLDIMTMPPFFPQNEAFVEKAGKKYGTEAKYVLSSGPFVLKKWSGSSDEYFLQKNKFYYDSDVVKTKDIRVQAVQSGTGYNLFMSNATDYAELSTLQANASKHDRSFLNNPTATTAYIQMNEKKVKALGNTDIRRALSYAINREVFTDKVLGGTAQPATTLTPKGLITDPKTDKDFTEISTVEGAVGYDLKQAKELFAKGMRAEGLTDLTLELVTDDTDAAKSSAQFLQSQLQELDGLKINIKIVPFKQRLALTQSKDFDLVISLWGADYPDPSSFLDLNLTGGAFNAGGWSNEEYDALIKKANTTDVNDEKKRYQDYADAEKISLEEMAVIPMYYRATPALQRTDIADMVYHPAGALFDWKWVYRK
ncbi:peptide ABC transporter substrate-binding protein [Weissella tructae]|uniref:YgiS protein n=2 Tax=Weissella TaxID=46255 RepID=A0A075TXJ0_9LACO|nr:MULTISPECIES: peptide ABC transporter substrate-binding protein [Weissella]AIG65021.1 YgiS protein [Weissella tructae]AIM62333.1 YgiS protein [Weissella ceti]AIM63672.1 YgiS protein [Weissella ceti]ELA07786.1 ABC-type oligopeptide transport system, periplasmic component [Weissella ceti NC36]QVV91427.1 peptide ABC transporter substrate-binding protein [Weissella tructae]